MRTFLRRLFSGSPDKNEPATKEVLEEAISGLAALLLAQPADFEEAARETSVRQGQIDAADVAARFHHPPPEPAGLDITAWGWGNGWRFASMPPSSFFII